MKTVARILKLPLIIKDTQLGRMISGLGEMTNLLHLTIVSLFKRPPTLSSFSNEVFHIGVKSFLIVAVTALAVGLVMAVQFGFGLARFGAKLYVPKVVSISIVRELGPIFTALMMAGRVGAGITAEVGSMKVTQQLDAMRALATDPIQKIVAPKILACIFVLPLLTVMADMIGIFGGMLISSMELNLPAYDYFNKSFEIITKRDVLGGLAKSVAFGFIIGLVGCHFGVTTTGGTQGVGNATTKSVVTASILVVFADFILTKMLWLIEMSSRTGGG